jgi:hypothetical protein
MKITICGSLKFHDQMLKLQKQLEALGHSCYLPIKVEGVNYWNNDATDRIHAKASKDLVSEHFKKIQASDAILVVNFTKHEVVNYIGANTFLEIGFAHFIGKKIFVLNPLPDQPYINEELASMQLIVLNGKLENIK